MSILKFLIPVGLAAAGVLAFTSSASAKKPTKEMPDALVKQVNDALESGDPTVMRKTAAKVKAAGFPEQAASLNEAAADFEAVIKSTQIVNPQGASGSIPVSSPGIPGSVPQGVGTPVKTPTQSAQRVFAGKVALMLTNSKKGSENREMVRAYQLQEQERGFTEVGAADGLYGVKTALTFAKDHGIVPPKPMYFPKNPAPSITLWRTEMSKIAASDPARAEEWSRAAGYKLP
jgi:hypothetical protein